MEINQKRKIILASSSPRRKEYLERYGLDFKIQISEIDEKIQDGELPINFVKRMAREKALAVKNECKNEVILAADTIVYYEGQILGKPVDRKDIFQMLTLLNNQVHQVITAFIILDCQNNLSIEEQVTTEVVFKNLSAKTIQAYANTNEPYDKAGSYSIQGVGTFLAKSINGSFNNVVGLPIEIVLSKLEELDIIEF